MWPEIGKVSDEKRNEYVAGFTFSILNVCPCDSSMDKKANIPWFSTTKT